jgi:hypothetical protein
VWQRDKRKEEEVKDRASEIFSLSLLSFSLFSLFLLLLLSFFFLRCSAVTEMRTRDVSRIPSPRRKVTKSSSEKAKEQADTAEEAVLIKELPVRLSHSLAIQKTDRKIDR